MVENRGRILAQGSRLETLTGPGGSWSGGPMLVEPGTLRRLSWGIAVIGLLLSLVDRPTQADVAIETPGNRGRAGEVGQLRGTAGDLSLDLAPTAVASWLESRTVRGNHDES